MHHLFNLKIVQFMHKHTYIHSLIHLVQAAWPEGRPKYQSETDTQRNSIQAKSIYGTKFNDRRTAMGSAITSTLYAVL